MDHETRSPRRSAAAWALSLAVLLGAGRYGGVETRVAAALTLVALAAAALAWPRTAHGHAASPSAAPATAAAPPSIPLLFLVLLAATLLVALQLLPLPPGLLRALSPRAAELSGETLAAIGLWPGWRPLSLAPGATADLLVPAAGVTAAAAAAAFLGGRHRRGEQLLAAIALSGLAVSVAGMLAPLLGRGTLLESRLTFVNPNHLAGFLLLAAWPAFGFALRARGRERVGWLAAFVLTSAGVFLTLSRGGISAFFLSAAVSSALAVAHGHTPLSRALSPRARREASDPARQLAIGKWVVPRWLRSFALPVGFASALAVASWLALEPVLRELGTLEGAVSEEKPAIWLGSLRLLREFPLFGIGRGAFATLYPSLKTNAFALTFTHLENTWLQLPMDLGLLGGFAVLGAFAWAWIASARQRELSRPMIGALAGAAGVAAQNFVDFSFELLGVALPFALVLGLASRAMPRVRLPRAAGLGLVALLAGIAVAGYAIHAREPADDVGVRIARSRTGAEAVEIAKGALAWRPVDWVPPAAAGVRLVAAGRCAEGLPWLARAMGRNPTAPEPHRYAARCLAAGGKPALARQEFRLAFLYGDGDALREAFARYPEPGALLEIAPQTPTGLRAAAELLGGRPEEAREAWKRAWEGFLDPAALVGLTRVTLQLGDVEEGLKLAREAQARDGREPWGWLLGAQALDRLGDPDGAAKELEGGLARLPGNRDLLVTLGQRLMNARRPSQARALFERIVALEGGELASKKLLIASTFAAQGRATDALATAQDAAATDRGSGAALEAIAGYAAAAGRADLAIDALERAGRVPGASPAQYADRIARLRAGELERQGGGGR